MFSVSRPLDAPMPIVAGLLTGVVFLAVGLMMIGLARRAAQGRLGRNPWAGIRIPSTMASDEAWFAGHRAAVVPMGIAGLGATLAGVIVLSRPSGGTALTTIALSSFWLVGWVLFGTVLASRAARSVGSPDAR